jgi:hypothetical protein
MYYPVMSEQAIPQPNGETAAALLADPQAVVRGNPVSATQLARWHREGYIPRPVRHGLGRGRGTVSIYPPGTRAQLQALCAFWSKERDAEKVQWRMWWAGYPAPAAFAEQWLVGSVQAWAEFAELWQTAQTEEDRALGILPEAAWDAIDEAREARLRSALMKRMRRRAGRDGFAAVMRMVLQASTGQFSGYHVDSTSGSTAEDQQDVVRALGLDRLKLPLSAGPRPDFAGELDAGLRYLSQLFAKTRASELINTATADDLAHARDDLRAVGGALVALAAFLREALGDQASASFHDIDQAIRQSRPTDQALFILLWLAMRRDGKGPEIDVWVQRSRMIGLIIASLQAGMLTSQDGEGSST